MTKFSVLDVFPSATSLLLIVSSITLLLIYYLRRKNSYWERRGVPYAKPTLLFGNTKDTVFQRIPIAFVFQQIYKELDGHKFGGFYQLTKPSLMVRDPDLIRTFLVKSFSNFHDRNIDVDEKLDPLTAHLLNLAGQRWKNVRYKLTPIFSSGKLRLMQEMMNDCVGELEEYLNDATTSHHSKTAGVQDLRELMAKFTTDVIGSCAFGFRCNSIRDENSEFRRIGRLIFKPNFRTRFRNILRLIGFRLISLLKIKAVNPEVEEFFQSVLREAVKYRETALQKRNDFLQLLIDLQAEEKKLVESNGHQQQNGIQIGEENGINKYQENNKTSSSSDILFTDNVVASNAFIFFIAGFETTASTLSYCLYELALNPDICEKMREEVESVKRAHDGLLDYNTMKELVYMESVISETLRKYPPASLLSRRCTESFQIPGTSFVVEEGTSIIISIYGLHHDPQYFPEPEKFLPDRFSEANKHSVRPGTYLPFGDGPRICIGVRFAIFEMKSVLSYLVSNFTVHPCEKTVIPLKFDCHSLLHTPEGGIWVRFQKRQNCK